VLQRSKEKKKQPMLLFRKQLEMWKRGRRRQEEREVLG
jgi:hypothetical protein